MYSETECTPVCDLKRDEKELLDSFDELPRETQHEILAYFKSLSEEDSKKNLNNPTDNSAD